MTGKSTKSSRTATIGRRTMQSASASLAAVLGLGDPALAQAFDPECLLPPAPLWSGASEALVAAPDHAWITPSEAAGFAKTPDYAQTMAWLKKLDRASSLVRLETFGKSPQGRDLIAAIVSRDGRTLDPRKPVILIQAGIHSGEIDGKDAGFMLLRDIAFRDRRDLIDAVNIVFVPILNVDGHERSSPFSRPNQRGPSSQGWRNTAQNLNLNRDFMKADAPEMQALLALINRYDPDFYFDLHVTDGMDYQYDITFGFDGWDGRYADSPSIGRWLDEVFRPNANAALASAGHIPGPLIFARDEDDLSKGIDLSAFAPRFSHAYGDLRRLPTVLVENHSLKPYRQRVLGTYVLLESTLKLLASKGPELKAAIASDRALRPATLPANWKTRSEPFGAIDFLSIESTQSMSAATGAAVTRWTGKPGPVVSTPVYGSEPGLQLTIPGAYWVPATKPEVIARLEAHGIAFETFKSPRTVEVEMLRLTQFHVGQPSEGRTPVVAAAATPLRRAETYPKGSVRVPTNQPLGALAAMLLEPVSQDSFLAWGFFSEILARVEYMEPYAIAPMAEAMLAADPALKLEFEKRLAEDQDFAASPSRRLSFFYERSPFYDDRHLLYPVGRELETQTP